MAKNKKRLLETFGITEMPRPAGALGGPMKKAIQWAAAQKGEFTARDLFKVWRQAGGQPNQPNDHFAYSSFQTSMRNVIAPDGRPDPLKPLVVTVKGKQGAGGQSTIMRYGGRGNTGGHSPPVPDPEAPDTRPAQWRQPASEPKASPKSSLQPASAKAPAAPSVKPYFPDASDDDDDFGGMDLGPAGASSEPAPGEDDDWREPDHEKDAGGDEEPAHDEDAETDAGFGPDAEPDDAADPQDDEPGDDEGEDADEDWPDWLPRPDADGNAGEAAMQRVLDAGGSSTDETWDAVAGADDSVAARKAITTSKSLPSQAKMPAMKVAQAIFKNRNKEW